MEQKSNLPLPIAVCEFHLDRPDDEVSRSLSGVVGCSHAFVVLRFRDVVVGEVMLPVIGNQISVDQVRKRASEAASAVWKLHAAAEVASSTPLPTASVVVCTHNRTDDLARCLSSLAQLASSDYEVIVIDNCPSDDRTEKLVATYPQFRYLCEPILGLDLARNRALLAASGEIVAFTDDDAQIEPGWLNALLSNFEDPMVAVVTGLTLPLELETGAQQWFEQTNSFGRGFVRKVFDLNTISPLAAGGVGAGVNMAIRRSALDEISMFDELLDGGTSTLSGGDQEFFYRTLARGFRIVYEPKAVVHHKHRRDWEALRHTIYGYGVGLFAWWTRALLIEKEFSLLFAAPSWFLQHHVRHLLRSLLQRPNCSPLELAWAEFAGAVVGPWRYLRAHLRARRPHQTINSRQILPASHNQRPLV